MDKKTVLENLARAAFENGAFNGAWLYAENGGIVSKGAFGFRDAENQVPMTEDSIFEMASVSKMFTATAVMLLVREGKLSLDGEYTALFPEYPYKGVTIRHLLTHTSGMPFFDVEELVGPVLDEEKRIPENSEIIRLIRKTGAGPACAPGEAFEYSDVNYMLLANAVEKASGMKFEDFMKKHVFEPAGMKDSGIYHTRRDGRPSGRFTRNMVLEDDGRYVPSDVSASSAKYVVGSDGMNGCDYLYTTIFDMLAWDRALREEKVLTLEEQRIMYAPMPLTGGGIAGSGDDEGYGFGWEFHTEPGRGFIVSHSGGMPGLGTWFERFVDADRVIVCMNCRDYSDARAYWSFEEGLEAVARDKEPEPFMTLEDIVVKDPDRSDWARFCGKYEHPEDADFIVDEVFMKDGALYANAIDDEGDALTFQLYPIGENVFGRKRGLLRLAFGEDCLMFDEYTCRKLQE
ncbi:MAG: beta-lactamase family protein [Lachnospiraceae bacterium]|nr:beta-lactamase family protein [Lachnospiraceae bacterium]